MFVLVAGNETAVGSDDPPPRQRPVTGGHDPPDRSGGAGPARLGGDLAVGDDLAGAHGSHDRVHRSLERTATGGGCLPWHAALPTIVGMRTLTDADADRHAAEIDDQGFTVVEDAFDDVFAKSVLDRLDAIIEERGIRPADNSFEGSSTFRVYNLLVHGEVFQRIPVAPSVLPVVERVLDRECLLSSLSSIDIRPGESAQPIHSDDQVIGLQRPHPSVVCNTMWAITDFTEANGATRLVPGSHRFDHCPEYGQEYDSVPGEMPAGSVLIWHGSLWHGGGTNASDDRRVGIASNYCAGFIRQQENQQLGIPTEVAATFGRRLLRLCGYGTYRGLIGHIDKRDPLTLLDPDTSTSMLWDHS